MDKIYIVVNYADPDEPYILDICTSEGVALDLRKQYRDNFMENGCTLEEADRLIDIEDAPLDNDVVWSYDA